MNKEASREKQEILLESGTNEVEIVMFGVADEKYGINVLKVREIINPVQVTKLPHAHVSVEGIIRLREEVIPVVDLAKVLQLPASDSKETDKLIIAELNKVKVAFRVHRISRIHRISWEQIEKPNELSAGEQAYAIGIIKLEEEMALLLDFEKIIVEINPESGVNATSLHTLGPRERSTKQIVAVEDSAVLRLLLQDTLSEAGYDNVTFFENGQEAWDYLTDLASNSEIQVTDQVDLIITDIEMPQMDGHHLTDQIKSHDQLKGIPVIIFSSIITGDLYHKGKQVGADAQVSKPEVVDLVKEIDSNLITE